MRQAAAAAAAAAVTDATRMQRPGSSSVAKPQLHLAGSIHHRHEHLAPSTQPHVPLQQQQHQQRPHQPAPPAAGPHQQQQHQQAGLVSQPVLQHPLASAPSPQVGPGDVEALSDSMEGDFVVVYTPQSSSTPHTRSSNSSSKASSGLADPKAAAVLQGVPQLAAAARRTWQDPASPLLHQQQAPVHQQGLYGTGFLQHPHGLIPVSTGGASQLSGAVGPAGAAAAGLMGLCGAGLSAGSPAAAGSTMQHSSLQLPTTPLQRVQLLVQVVRSCVSLLAARDSSGGPHDAAGRQALHYSERLALLLLALQVVQLLCCPEQGQHTQQQGHEGGGDRLPDLASVLASASQSDVEQLMTAVVDLLRLAEAHTKSLAEQPVSAGQAGPDGHHAAASCQQQPGTSTCWDSSGAVGGAAGTAGAAASHMISSLMQLPLPDPAGVLYHAALDSCRGAAVEEVMGNWQAALDGYSLAADLLLFLSQQWPELPAPADPALQAHQAGALHRLYGAVNSRLTTVVADAPPLALTC